MTPAVESSLDQPDKLSQVCSKSCSTSPSKKRRMRAAKTRQSLWSRGQKQADILQRTGERENASGPEVEPSLPFQSAVVGSESDTDVKDSVHINVDTLADRVDEHVEHLMKRMRGAFPRWPPIAEKSEPQGCQLIREICVEGITDTLAASLQDAGADVPTDDDRIRLRACIVRAADRGLTRWKEFAGMVAVDHEPNVPSVPMPRSTGTCSLKPLSRRGMAQSSKRPKKKNK
eukprot:TRINITY_DN35168_c0_g1_i1.p1 TRINITY_DN35168_c0_g1~~TRINITY_DN35168_c0_g1_i1.p1  ORF type:complete len:231 (-),score=17.49 TRINITY_DN35168_c0_g1_i1:217-909(-)